MGFWDAEIPEEPDIARVWDKDGYEWERTASEAHDGTGHYWQAATGTQSRSWGYLLKNYGPVTDQER